MSLIPWKWGSGRTGMTRAESDPFMALQREINRAFDSFLSDDWFRDPLWLQRNWANGAGFLTPRVDVSETESEVHVTVELPGLSEKDLDVELRENQLRIAGEKKDERSTQDHNFHRMERTFGAFERIIPLPAKVQREGVQARFKDGVLSIVMPKVERSRVAQKIPVQAGN
jgi:HSP20 family protein